MSNEQHAKDLSALVMRLASNGDIESLALMARVLGNIESAENPAKTARASRVILNGSTPIVGMGMISKNYRDLASGMREVLAEASFYAGGGDCGFHSCEEGVPLSPAAHAQKIGWDVEPYGKGKFKAFKDGVAMMEWDNE